MRERYRHGPMWAFGLAMFSLILLPAGLTQPFMIVEKMGVAKSVSVLDGIFELYTKRQELIAIVVLLCSVVFPIAKNLALIAVSVSMYTGGRGCGRLQTVLCFLSRYAHLDIYVMAILITAMKLRPMIIVTAASPGLPAFTTAVVLSLISSIILPRRATYVSQRERNITMSRSPFLKSVSLIAFGCMLGVMSTLGLQLYSPLQRADVTVVFDNVDGIKPGALVKDVAGVDIGTVMAVRSAPQNRAELLIRFNSGEQLPGEESKFRIEGGMQFSLASVSGSFTEARFVRFERGGGKIVDQFVGQSKSQEKEGVKDSLMNLLGRT